VLGAGSSDPGEFDIFMEARVKFPTPRYLLNVKFPPLGDLFPGLSVFQEGLDGVS